MLLKLLMPTKVSASKVVSLIKVASIWFCEKIDEVNSKKSKCKYFIVARKIQNSISIF